MTASRLYCVRCYRRKPRTDFRETPWHGRAAACKSCEALRWVDYVGLRQSWQLEQECSKVRMLVRHIQRLRMQRIVERAPELFDLTSDDVGAVRRRKRAQATLMLERKR